MQRKCRYKPLSAHPLVLVLCQFRFSPVRQWPKEGRGAENLVLTRRMDELHMDYPFYGSRCVEGERGKGERGGRVSGTAGMRRLGTQAG